MLNDESRIILPTTPQALAGLPVRAWREPVVKVPSPMLAVTTTKV